MSVSWLKLPRPFRFIFLAGLVCLVSLVCLTPVWAYNTLVLRHERAYQRWVQRHPPHYRYKITISSTFLYLNYLVEMRDGQLEHVTNLRSGNEVNLTPYAGLTNMPGYQVMALHLQVESLFSQIRIHTVRPATVKALVSRSNPALYGTFVNANLVRDGWQSCQPAYPQVQYNPVYGYPENLTLYGDPCTNIPELSVKVKVKIEAFEALP